MGRQGYNVDDYANFSINEVHSMKQNNQLDMLLETRDDIVTPENPKKKMYIRYYLNARPAPKNIQEMIDDLFVLTETLKKTDTLFIIIKDDPNETLINELKHIWEKENMSALPIAVDAAEVARDSLIDQAIDSLPPRRKEVYLLSRHERIAYKEIANRLGISKESVKTHLKLANNAISFFIRSNLPEITVLFINIFINF